MKNEILGFKLKWKDKLFLICLAFLLAWVGYQKIMQRKIEKNIKTEKTENIAQKETEIQLKVGNVFAKVELAETSEKRFLGLGKRDSLEDDSGMLFLHENSGKHIYSMRDMNFPLDFIFIQKGIVVDLKEKIAFDFSGEIFGQEEYDSVLEMNSGWVEKNGIKVGDMVFAQK